MNYEMKGKLIAEMLTAFGIEEEHARVVVNKDGATLTIDGEKMTKHSQTLISNAAQGTYESDRAYNHKLEASKYGAAMRLTPVEPGLFKLTLVVNQFLVPRTVGE